MAFESFTCKSKMCFFGKMLKIFPNIPEMAKYPQIAKKRLKYVNYAFLILKNNYSSPGHILKKCLIYKNTNERLQQVGANIPAGNYSFLSISNNTHINNLEFNGRKS